MNIGIHMQAKNSIARSPRTIGSAIFIYYFPEEVLLDDEEVRNNSGTTSSVISSTVSTTTLVLVVVLLAISLFVDLSIISRYIYVPIERS